MPDLRLAEKDLVAKLEDRRVGIYSRLDLDAAIAFDAYRQKIGLAPIPQRDPDRYFAQMGAWIDGLAPWALFVTATFRPVVRRWGNRARFAQVEETGLHRNHGLVFRLGRLYRSGRRIRIRSGFSRRSFQTRLASYSPGMISVQNFFAWFIRKLQRDLCCRLSWFVGFEAGRLSGMVHFHALMAIAWAEAPFEFWRHGLHKWLFREAGRSLVLPFEKDRGAGWYLTQAYVGKRPLGWDVHVYGKTHLQRRSKPGGRALSLVPSASLSRSFFHCTLPRWHR